MQNIVSAIIVTEFEKNVKRWQSKSNSPVAMKVTFRLSCDYEKEEGYRKLEILIYGHNNYVCVLVNEKWDVINLSDLSYDRNGESYIKKNTKGYIKGETGWQLASYHDSCWRTDGIEKVIYKNKERISGIGSIFEGWYEKVNMTEEFLEEIMLITEDRTSYYVPMKNVFQF